MPGKELRGFSVSSPQDIFLIMESIGPRIPRSFSEKGSNVQKHSFKGINEAAKTFIILPAWNSFRPFWIRDDNN